MKWLLIYEFDVEIYRRAPTVRIFLEDVLLNEFTLEKRTFEVIEFDYKPKNENNLTIEFINDDSNYTNGFITKSTYVKPKCLYIMPKYVVKNYRKITKHYAVIFGKMNYYIYRKTGRSFKNTTKFKFGWEYIKHYYKDRIIYPQNLTQPNEPYLFKTNYGESKKHNFTYYKKHGLFLLGQKHIGFLIHNYNHNPLFEKLEHILKNK